LTPANLLFGILWDTVKQEAGERKTKMKRKKTTTRPWDVVEHLKTEEDMAAYLEAALEDGDPALISAALGDIARARGMTEIARETGLGRESLYKALSPEGNPEFVTVLKVIRALRLELHVETAETRRERRAKSATGT
jgi:probable addiction module antidote protein